MEEGAPVAASWLPARIPGFLAPGECRELRSVVDVAHQHRAQTWTGEDFRVDPRSRLGAIADLPGDAEELVQDRLWEVVPGLEERYGCEISHLSGVTALVYRRGDHFAAHADGGVEADADAPEEIRRRRISLVVALNDGASAEAEFSGGELRFYPGGRPGGEPPPGRVIAVRSEPGLLVAFPSPMFHQVMPVAGGCRYSLALWALAPPG